MNAQISQQAERENILAEFSKTLAPTSHLIVAPTNNVLNQLRQALVLRDVSCALRKLSFMGYTTIYTSERYTLLGPIVGKASTKLAAEPFLARGARRISLLGVCGCFSASGLSPGDLLSPSRIYNSDTNSWDAVINALETRGVKSTTSVKSISSPWQSKEYEREALQVEQGACFDMECEAVYELAKRYQATFAAILAVSDFVDLKAKPFFSRPEFRSNLSRAVGIFCDYILSYE